MKEGERTLMSRLRRTSSGGHKEEMANCWDRAEES